MGSLLNHATSGNEDEREENLSKLWQPLQEMQDKGSQ